MHKGNFILCNGKETKIPYDFLINYVSNAVFNPKYLENQKWDRTQYKYFINSSLKSIMDNLWDKKIPI